MNYLTFCFQKHIYSPTLAEITFSVFTSQITVTSTVTAWGPYILRTRNSGGETFHQFWYSQPEVDYNLMLPLNNFVSRRLAIHDESIVRVARRDVAMQYTRETVRSKTPQWQRALSCWNIMNGWATIVPVRRPQSNWTHFILLSVVAVEYAIQSRKVSGYLCYSAREMCGARHGWLLIVIYTAQGMCHRREVRFLGFAFLGCNGRAFWYHNLFPIFSSSSAVGVLVWCLSRLEDLRLNGQPIFLRHFYLRTMARSSVIVWLKIHWTDIQFIPCVFAFIFFS
jgi:hypothetical protein